MRGTANTSTEGQYCGRAVHGVSNIGLEQMREIEAHRAKDRPTPWAHLALRYGVNEIDLRGLFDPSVAPRTVLEATAPPSRQQLIDRREERFATMWNAGVSALEILSALGISHQTAHNMRVRLGLAKRSNGGRPPACREMAA